MRTRLIKLLEDLRASYWFLPACMAVGAFALSFLMPWVDTRVSIAPDGPFGWIAQTGTDGARTVLGAVAGSIIGVTGTTFSITMVAVSFAGANFGPRLIANFMRDRGSQLTLGTFIATFVYCLLVLRRVHGAAGDSADADYAAFVPHLSVLLALALALASVAMLIFFIHHAAEMVSIDRLIADIGRTLERRVVERVADGVPDLDLDVDEAETGDLPDTDGRREVEIGLGTTGYVQAFDLEHLDALAAEHDLLVRVRHRPGDFVVGGEAVLELAVRADPGEELIDELRGCFAIGSQRTVTQNHLFLVDQLVEVIGRALSPGINDPFTAIACLDWLKAALARLIEGEARRTKLRRARRVTLALLGVERVVERAFDQTRAYVAADRNVCLHAIGVLAELADRATLAEHRELLTDRLHALHAAAREALADAGGGEDVGRRYREALALLGDEAARERLRDGAAWFGGSA